MWVLIVGALLVSTCSGAVIPSGAEAVQAVKSHEEEVPVVLVDNSAVAAPPQVPVDGGYSNVNVPEEQHADAQPGEVVQPSVDPSESERVLIVEPNPSEENVAEAENKSDLESAQTYWGGWGGYGGGWGGYRRPYYGGWGGYGHGHRGYGGYGGYGGWGWRGGYGGWGRGYNGGWGWGWAG